jgi:hypothetical protein
MRYLKDSECFSRDSKRGSPEYKTEELPLEKVTTNSLQCQLQIDVLCRQVSRNSVFSQITQ